MASTPGHASDSAVRSERSGSIAAESVVASCCINSAAMLQIADEPGHSDEKLRRFRELNEKQANLLFNAAVIADEMLEALRNTLSLLKVFTRETDEVAKAVWDQAEAAIARATGKEA